MRASGWSFCRGWSDCVFWEVKQTKYSCWICIIASSSYWELPFLCFMMITFHFLFVFLIMGHICPCSIWCWVMFVPSVLVVLDFWNIASITFSLDKAVKDVFPLVKAVRRGIIICQCKNWLCVYHKNLHWKGRFLPRSTVWVKEWLESCPTQSEIIIIMTPQETASHRDLSWRPLFSTSTSLTCQPPSPESMHMLTTWQSCMLMETGRQWKGCWPRTWQL